MPNILTPTARASYPNLFKPKLNSLNGKMEYSVDLLFPKDQDISWLKKAMDEAVTNKWGAKKPKVLNLPIKDGDSTKPKSGEPYGAEYHGHYFITLKNTRKPGLVDAQRQPIIDEDEIYGGVFLRASFSPFAYEHKSGSGVSLSLVAVQKVKDGDPLSGAARFDPEVEFDEIESDEANNPANYAPAPKKNLLG